MNLTLKKFIQSTIREVEQSIGKKFSKRVRKSSSVIDYINLIGLSEIQSSNEILDIIVEVGIQIV
jgi:hypothetical protein